MRTAVSELVKRTWRFFRYYLGSGLIAIVPVVVTVYIFVVIVKFVDRVFIFLLPKPLEGIVKFPGFGFIMSILLITLTGFLVRNRAGTALERLIDRIVARIPFARVVYQAVKRFMEAFLEDRTEKFQRPIAFEYPRRGVYTLGFVTGEAKGIVKDEKKYLSVFMPTTPNPTSGFYLIIPEEEAVPLKLTVEEAFRIIISGGIAGVEDDG